MLPVKYFRTLLFLFILFISRKTAAQTVDYMFYKLPVGSADFDRNAIAREIISLNQQNLWFRLFDRRGLDKGFLPIELRYTESNGTFFTEIDGDRPITDRYGDPLTITSLDGVETFVYSSENESINLYPDYFFVLCEKSIEDSVSTISAIGFSSAGQVFPGILLNVKKIGNSPVLIKFVDDLANYSRKTAIYFRLAGRNN